MSVRVKLITVLTSILISAFIFLSLFNYNETRKNIRSEIVNSSLPLTRDNIYSEIQATLTRPLFVSSLMANDTFLKDWASGGESDLSQIKRYLTEIQEEYGFFTSFLVSAKTGKYYYSKGILKLVSKADSHDVWFYDFIKSGDNHDLDVDTNEAAADMLTIFINHKLEGEDGELLGVTGVGLKMGNVSSLLKSFSQKYGKNIFLVDGNGLVQVHHKIGLIEKINIRHMPGLKEIASKVLNTSIEPAMYEVDVNGDKTYVTSRYIPELKWILIVEQNEELLLSSARENFMRTLVVGGLATLIIVCLSILTVNHYQLKLEHQADTDELTGLGNRRSFERKVNASLSSIVKNGIPFSLVLMDLDGFKQVNDELGHLKGDLVLKEFSRMLRSSVNSSDFCARWGGDEFIVLVSGDIESAYAKAESIRKSFFESDCLSDELDEIPDVQVTVSCGVVQYEPDDSIDSLTRRADRALYASKERGRNTISKG